jgi:hypothetical protein
MAKKKKKAKIQASEIVVSNRALDNVLLDLAEQIKDNDARYAERATQMAERKAQIEECTARNEELITIALRTIAAVSQDLRAITEEFRGFNRRIDERVTTLEKAPAAE